MWKDKFFKKSPFKKDPPPGMTKKEMDDVVKWLQMPDAKRDSITQERLNRRRNMSEEEYNRFNKAFEKYLKKDSNE